MSFNDLEQKRIENALAAFLARRRPPVHVRAQVDIGCRQTGQSIELFEIRPQWDDPTIIREHPFAKATYVKTQKVWKVFWRRADLKWHGYEPTPTVKAIEEFIAIVHEDKHACFFG
jgi:hypothetical protein